MMFIPEEESVAVSRVCKSFNEKENFNQLLYLFVESLHWLGLVT